MARYIAVVVVVSVAALTAYLGLSWYRSYVNTPERVMADFAADLAAADANHTYERFTTDLKRQHSKEAWQRYVHIFEKNSSEPK
ncbi:MAG: hypothetical protein AAB834_03450, partial [Patescibacteria group bacterium]